MEKEHLICPSESENVPMYMTASYLLFWTSLASQFETICTGGASLEVNLALHLDASNTQLSSVVLPVCCKWELICKLKPWCGSLSYVQSRPWYLQGDVSESVWVL